MEQTLLTSPATFYSRKSWLLGRCSCHLRKSCAGASTVYSRKKRVFILQHYFASKSFAAVLEEALRSSNSYTEGLKQTTTHRLVKDSGRMWPSRRWWTLPVSAMKLFCKFLLRSKIKTPRFIVSHSCKVLLHLGLRFKWSVLYNASVRV
jgi:hypothetical protein